MDSAAVEIVILISQLIQFCVEVGRQLRHKYRKRKRDGQHS